MPVAGSGDERFDRTRPDPKTIRAAVPGDFHAMQAIEVEAGLQFADIGMQAVADDPPFSIDELAAFVDDGLAWVALDDTGGPAGYLILRHGFVEVVRLLVHARNPAPPGRFAPRSAVSTLPSSGRLTKT
jgi:hypothetical protein